MTKLVSLLRQFQVRCPFEFDLNNLQLVTWGMGKLKVQF